MSIEYTSPGPVADRFLLSTAFIDGIRGPFGSGKSTAAIMKLIKNCAEARRQKDGWIRRRTGIIRNTYPELKTTTIKTWHDWIPKDRGHWRDQGPPSHHLVDQENRIDWEVWFVALDSEKDVARLLSMELSDAWINEAREIPKAILDGLTGRVGRYPKAVDGGCPNAQILLDTNSPDSDHWWFVLAERDTSTERNRQLIASMDEAEAQLRAEGVLGQDQPLMEFHAQPGGREPGAENVANLRPGYYQFLMAGKSEQFIKVYVDNCYGFVQDGKPVYPEYRDSLHCREFEVMPGRPVVVGLDFGLTPAAALLQRTVMGQWRCVDELCANDMGAARFAKALGPVLKERFPATREFAIWGDPAGAERDADERTVFQVLAANGIVARAAPSQDPTLRREAVRQPLGRLIDGEPGLVVHPRCHMIRRGLGGRFRYRRVQVSGTERYEDKPEKNEYSHPCEALEYGLLGGGENAKLPVGGAALPPGPIRVKNDWKVFRGR